MAIPTAKTIASSKAIPAFPAKNPAKHTPTAIPSGMLCSVTENVSMFSFFPLPFSSIFSAILLIKMRNKTPKANPTAAGTHEITP